MKSPSIATKPLSASRSGSSSHGAEMMNKFAGFQVRQGPKVGHMDCGQGDSGAVPKQSERD